MTLEVNGIELYYEVTGSGKPLILVHGNGEDHTIFDKAVEMLQNYFTCYSLDSRGHGKSSKAAQLDYVTMAEDVACFLDRLDLNDVTFYGFSDGGIIGLILAQRTDRIKNLIVSGANTDPKGIKNWFITLFRISYFFKHDPKVKMMIEEPHISDLDLQKIKARTLVLAGEKDLIKEEHTRHIAENIENAVLKIVPREGHGSYIIHSAKIAEIIIDFAAEML